MAKTQKWWTYPCEAENGRKILVSGRDGVDKERLSGKYIYRVEVCWKYRSETDGMPDVESADMLGKVTDALEETFSKENVAVMTGIYTGDGRRDWVFYVKNLNIFSGVFNKALRELPTLPLEFEAEEDAGWEEYMQMREMTYIPEEKE